MESKKDQNPDDEPLSEIAMLFDQVVLMVSQTSNSITHHRRDNILSTLIESSTKVKDILRDQSKELDASTNESLFGKDFQNQMIKDSKAVLKSKDLFTGLKPNRQPRGPSSTNNGFKNRPLKRASRFVVAEAGGKEVSPKLPIVTEER